MCVSAGEALPHSLRQAWSEQTGGLSIVNGYGASETLVLVMTGARRHRRLQALAGRGHRAARADLATGLPTRLKIRAPTLALGYLDRPQAQAEAFRDDAFCPADLFARNAAGGWAFGGREDSLVKIGGRWVNLVELEERLLQQASGVIEAAAVCVPDADGVDSVALFYVRSQPGRGQCRAARQFAEPAALPAPALAARRASPAA